MKRKPVKELWNDNLYARPVDYDWSNHVGYGEYEVYEAGWCDTCDKAVLPEAGVCPTCENAIDLDGPMMNYYYPIRLIENANESALAIAHLPLCVVSFDTTEGTDHALALTGGGMDLSWEICEAYMRCGQLPPLHFADLPRMCMELTPTKKWVLAGCRRSARVAVDWSRGTLKRLSETARWIRNHK